MCLVALSAVLYAFAAHGATTERQTIYGKIQGMEDVSNTWAWLGIPYAKPPVAGLRWKAPRNPDPWDGAKQTTSFCEKCPQYSKSDGFVFVGNEDCLYLNIWRPQSQEANLPVYFWIHGGGNTVGTASSDGFNGANMAFRSNMVIVTINYRLGPLGWFTHPALRTGDAQDDSGNYGNLDFRKALEWVRDNIEAFGGDPNNITIAGESAGAGNVLSLVISPLSTGLFHKGIMQSGSLSCRSVSQGEGHAIKKIKKLLINDGTAADGTEAQAILDTWTNAQIETYLRGKSAEQVFGAYEPYSVGFISVSKHFTDGTVLPSNGMDSLEDGTYPNKIPLILGSNLEEIKLFLVSRPYFAPKFADGSFWSNQDYKDFYRACAHYGSDFWKIYDVDTNARKFRSAVGQPDVYAYRFDWGSGAEVGPSLSSWYNLVFGACHTIEIPFFFGNEVGGMAGRVFNEENRPGREVLSRAMMAYVANFARTGDPNGVGVPTWSPWSNIAGQSKQIIFDVDDNTQALDLQMSTIELTKEGVEANMAADRLCQEIQSIFENWYSFLSWSVPCTATVRYYIDPNGQCGGNSPCYTSIQKAINAARSGATLLIPKGTYTESLDLTTSKSLTLQGGWDSSFSTQTSNATFIKAPKVTQGSLTMQMLTIKPL